MGRSDGFTLIEILLVVGVISVLAAMSVPMIADAMQRYEVISGGQQVVSTMRAARFQAVARNRDVRVRFNFPAADQYQTEILDPVTGWGTLGQAQYLPQDISFGAGVPADLVFEPTGRPDLAEGCPCTVGVTNGDEVNDKTITVTISGQIQLQ